MTAREDAWIQTYTGKVFKPFAPEPSMVCIEDIAHALAHICRFGGHCRFFWSVASHSVCVSRSVRPELAVYGLLHDAAEAYVGDIVSPIKRELADFADIEARAQDCILEALGLPPPLERHHDEIRSADLGQLAVERAVLHHAKPQEWEELAAVRPDFAHTAWIERVSPSVGELVFLHRWAELRP